MSTETTAAPLENAFLPVLEACEDGVLLTELSDRTRELISAMRQQSQARGGKPKGTLTLTLDFKLDGANVELRANVTTKEPKAERQRTIFWHLRDGTLSPDNPKQTELNLPPREVGIPSAAPRLVG